MLTRTRVRRAAARLTNLRGPATRLRGDQRGIEGLPVRLVVALVVGVACLSVMLSLVQGIGTLAVSEVDVRPEPSVVTPGTQELLVTVVDPDGDPVADATVILSAGTAGLDGVATATTDEYGRVSLSVSPTLGPNQERGTLVFDVQPPPGSEYVDRRGNSRVLVVDAGG